MLKGCSWQQFLIAASVFTLVWVLIILLVYFRKELFAFFSGQRGADRGLNAASGHPLQRDFREEPAEAGAGDDEDVMGRPALPEGVSVVEQDDFTFKAREPVEDEDAAGVSAAGPSVDVDSDAAGADADTLQSDVFDLMEDVKPLIADASLGREELIERVNDQVRFYSRLVKSPLLDSVYELIAEQVNASEVLGFELSAEELKENL